MSCRTYVSVLLLVATLRTDPQAQPSVSQNLKADQVIANWRAAVRAPEWTPSLEASAVTASNEDGVSSEAQEWITAGGDYHSVINRPYDTTACLLVGSAGSLRDWNGFVSPMAGNLLRRLKTAVYEEDLLLFGPPPSVAATVIDSADSALTLSTSTPAGDTILWYIDRTTWRPVKSVVRGEDSEIMTTYEDWRDASGILIPFKGKVEETDKPAFTWERTSIALKQGSGEQEFAPLAPGPPDTYFTGPTEAIPFTFENEHIIFKVGVNKSAPLWWLLDTGADQNVVNKPRLPYFGLEPYGLTTTTGGGGSADYSYARGATFELPGVELRKQHVAVMDLTGLERAYGMVIGGILGFDFISRFVVEIDYEKHLVTLHDPSTWECQGDGLVVPVTIDAGIPYAGATISVPTRDSVPANMLIDFGAAETMTLTSPFVKANDLIKLAGTNTAVNKMAGLEKQFFAQTNVRGRIRRFAMGGLVVDSFPANLSVNTTGAYASTEFSGTVGEGIFHRYHTYLDYSRNRIILEPTPEAAKPFPERKTYGMTLLASGDDYHIFTIAGVRAGSPAEQDGFKKGDVIIGLDNRASAQFTLAELRDALTREGEHHDLKVSRGDSTLSVDIQVRRISIEEK